MAGFQGHGDHLTAGGFERQHNLGTFVLAEQGTGLPFCAPDAGIGIERQNEDVAQGAGLLQKAYVLPREALFPEFRAGV